METLIRLLNDMGVSFEYSSDLGINHGRYYFNESKVEVLEGLSNEDACAVMCHEIGHVVSNDYVAGAISYGDLIKSECNAWRNGRVYARMLIAMCGMDASFYEKYTLTNIENIYSYFQVYGLDMSKAKQIEKVMWKDLDAFLASQATSSTTGRN